MGKSRKQQIKEAKKNLRKAKDSPGTGGKKIQKKILKDAKNKKW